MSRTMAIILIGGVASLVVMILGFAALLINRDMFVANPQPIALETPTPIVVVTQDGVTQPAATAPVEQTVAATAVATASATPTATAVTVSTTSVQYVLALANVNIRSGPGANADVVGWVAEGQTAKVTGVNQDGSWWRVVCPNGAVGSCWVTANLEYVRPTNAPVSQPTATTPAACTNAAAFVADVTIPDGSQIMAGDTFNKVWRIRNNGTCVWDGRYTFVHAGGPTLGAVTETMPLPAAVAPGQTIDLSVVMLAPVTAGSYQSDWKLQSPQGAFFGVGRNNSPLWVKVNVVSPQPANTIMSGVVYQDANQNGVFDAGEMLMANREVWLITGTACQVRQDPSAVTYSGSDGRYTFSGSFSGNYCLGLPSSAGLEDVVGVAVTAGQTLSSINLKAAIPNGSISGWLWDDYCLTNAEGDALDGSCVADGNGDYHADGMIEPTEGYISGVTILLQLGSCLNNNNVAVAATTDAGGRYIFNNLGPGTYCVSMNAASPENGPRLLPGDWTFPARGIWYQEITLRAGDSAYPVNFGWDYQLR